MRATVISSAELAAQPEAGLNARYWVEREPGETFTAWRLRGQLDELERRAANHDAAAARLREQAAQLRAEGVADGQGA